MQWWKAVIGVIGAIGVIGVGWSVTRPVPGSRMDDQGREHVTPEAVAAFAYNSNPPTSGPHLPTWVKAGIFDRPQSEGELIHSLEHGYVIISYNCNIHLGSDIKYQISNIKYSYQIVKSLIPKAFAHGDEEASASSSFTDPTIATGSAVNEGDGCKTLVKQLTEVANKKKLWKLIVVPRPNLETTIALTAWNYIDRFDAFDAGRIERFVDYHRDQGPEKTME